MGGEGGADGLVGIAFDLFAMCHILRFRNIKWANARISPVYNFTVLCLIKLFWFFFLQILSIMGGGGEENTLTWPSQRYSPWLIYLQNEKL